MGIGKIKKKIPQVSDNEKKIEKHCSCIIFYVDIFVHPQKDNQINLQIKISYVLP